MKKKLFAVAMAAILLAPSALQAKVKHLLPKPQQITATENAAPLTLGGTVTISYSGGAEKCDLLEEFFTTNGCTLAESGGTAVNVSLVESIEGAYDYELHGYENEAYTLDVTASGINITAVTPTGIIRAAQTLTQLAEGWDGTPALEAVSIKDWPAFKLRGYMHDVGRSFISIDELIKQVELFSRFKVNTFHWHLTENQAWRFEVKAYPALTFEASMTRFTGNFYTQDDCKRLMEVAKKHGVVVVPEIDMPGHSAAFERAMGFDMQSEEGKKVLKAVLDEVVEVFADAPYIHIGGDEVTTTADYLNEMIAYVESKGKQTEIWNPINGISQDNLNASLAQMWGTRGFLASGKANIDSRYNYTNHFDVFADLVGIYKSTIYYSQKGSKEVAGAVSGCWNDRKVADEVAIMAQNNVWANVIATAERAWMGGGKQYIDNSTNTPDAYKSYPCGGGVMLPNSGEEYEAFKSWEERFLFHKANSLKGEPIPYVKQTNVRWRITDAFPNGGSETAAFGPEAAGITASTDLLPEVYTHEGKTYYSGMATGAGIYLSHTWGNSIINAYYSNPQYNHTAYAWTYVYSDKEQKVGAQIEFQNYSRSEQDGAAPAGKWDHFGSKIWINGEEIAAPTWENTGVSISSKEVELKNENFPGRKPIEVTLKQGWNKVFLKLPYFNKGYRLKKWMFTCVFTDIEGVNAVEGLIYSPNQCKDEATELVAAKISEIKRDRGNLIGTAIGLWPESAATELDSKIAEIEGTYDETKTDEERAAQITALENAWTDFAASLTDANMNQPIDGNYYRMYTPLRSNRYATGNGVDAAITGPTEATTKASIWQFVKRSDNSYDIINLADGTYITTSGSPLKCVASQPSSGWSIKKAETTGNVIVVSGTNQFNQQKDGSYQLLNWGSGTNTTDDGCEYCIIDVTDQIPPQPIVKVEGLSDQTYPYAIDDALADKVFAKENITIALDVTMPASMAANTRYALVCAADPTQAVTGATKTNSPYVAYGLNGSNPAYLPSSASGDKFTYRDFSFTGNTNYKVVYVIDCTNKKFSIYVDGALKSSATYPVSEYELQSFGNFATNTNAKLYIGGGVVSSNASYDKFAGKVRSVQFFDEALSAEKIAQLEYPINPEDIILEKAAEANANMNIFGMQRYLGLVQNAGTGIDGNGQFVCNYPAATSQESGNAYANLIDGNYTTFFHSGYGNTIGSGSHYLQADLGKAVKSFRFYFKKRSQNNANRPTKITIEGSNDGDTWAEVKVISNGLPTEAAVTDYYSEEISSATAYSKLRFTINTTNTTSSGIAFFTFSEFYILPNDYGKVAETFDAVRAYRAGATVETATALNSVYAWNKGLNEGSPIVGVESYIYADTYKDGGFVNRFLYNNNGTLTLTTESQNTDAFIWTPAVTEDGKYNFANKAGKFLAHKDMSDNAHNFTVAASTHHMGVTLHTQGSNYFVILNANGAFDQSTTTYDQTTTAYCTDFVFIPADLYKEAKMYVKAEVEGLEANNPNTHLGDIRVNGAGKKFTLTTGVTQYAYNGMLPATIDFTRGYRGFELVGFFLGGQNLGKNVTLTEEQKTLITEANPLVAKFTPTDEATLFYDDDVFSYRIPAIATTSTGRLIAVSDYRHSLDDIGRYNFGTANPGIDLVIRTSDDNGKTWSATKTIAEGSGKRGSDDCAYGDAAIAVVGEKVLVMGAAGDVMFGNGSATAHNRTVRILSEDNGVTWTAPQDISETLFIGDDATIQNGYTAFFGSGKLAVDENYNGSGKARIYGAMLIKKEGVGNAIYVIYTDDLGLSWSILGGSQTHVTANDEPKVEILPGGQILLSVRRGGGRQFNVFTYTDKATNAGSWANNVNGCGNGGSNTCNGEIFCIDAKKADGSAVKLLLQSQPKGGSGLYDRRNVTIWYKEVTDAAYTSEQIAADWTEGMQVSTQLSSYSTMSLQKDGKIAFFFEEAPCYDDNYAKGYSMVYIPLTIEQITKGIYSTPEVKDDDDNEGGDIEVSTEDALPGDGTLRFYRLAIPVTVSAFENDLQGDYGLFDDDYQDKVIPFWQACEDFVNEVFVPLGMCFDVVMDKRLVMTEHINALDKSEELPEIGNCTNYINDAIGEGSYDVGMWVTHRETYAENSGLSVEGGAYISSAKGSGYAKTDKWVVAHELGHMFGAPHTTTGEGSLMDSGGDDFFAYPSIKTIRSKAKGTSSYKNVKVDNNAPKFNAEAMQETYRIPQGACLSIDVQAADAEGHRLLYTAIGCSSANVDNIVEGGSMPHFASFVPQESNVITYQPTYIADIFNDDEFYLKDGTNVPNMESGNYALSILVNDVPSTAWSYSELLATPFYSTYTIWESQVQIVGGTAFNATLTPVKSQYTAGEQVTVSWGVNENYFTADSRLRISLSTDYGKTFKYVLAESVEALAGECTVTLPNVNIGQVDVDFTTATRQMSGGIIKVEEIGGSAFTLTTLDPKSNSSFTVTGGVDESDVIITTLGEYEIGTFYANEPMTIPAGVTAYVATTTPVMNDTEGTITMTAIADGIIPAETGVVICGEAGQYLFTKANTEGTTVTGNLLLGYAGTEEYANVDLPDDGSVNYVLTVKNDVAGFYRKDAGFKVYKNKAYLNVPASLGAARAIYFNFDDETTGILETEDGELKTENCYDLSGRRVEKLQKGIYILNGKKVLK